MTDCPLSLPPASKTGIGDDLRDGRLLFVGQRQRQARTTRAPAKLAHGLFDGRVIGSGLEATIEGEDVTAEIIQCLVATQSLVPVVADQRPGDLMRHSDHSVSTNGASRHDHCLVADEDTKSVPHALHEPLTPE